MALPFHAVVMFYTTVWKIHVRYRSSMHIEHAIILAAGLGTRLTWLTKSKPKALMMIQGEPAIVHVLRQLSGQGIRNVVINVHHHAQQLMDALGTGAHWGMQITYSEEKKLLDSGGGVRTAMQYLPENVPFMVHNADIISDLDVHKLCQYLPAQGCALALVSNPQHHPSGDFSCQQHRVQRQGEPRYTFAGISLWHSQALLHYPCDTAFSLVQAMQEHIHHQTCAGLVHQGQWFDIGRPRDWMRANKDWRQRKRA